ncbi:tetratricopeptide repeat protein [Sorangium cellulosum]|uniref:tetratricopeptide repeat protein n=1 Tax=Sorangium TaxID=39643 RepID=UPI000A5D38D6|nr:tetratricopeptide repeat protein [Sorangium cellulosum]
MGRSHGRLPLALCAATLGLALQLSPALAQVEPYRQHMANGIKLFQDRNYPAAIAEFEAAYKEKPKASPLFNIALAEKALFNYPRAIAALERALAQHRDTMDESDEKTARGAIEEMRALLAQVTIELSPQSATLIIDGQEHPPSSSGTRVVELGPGVHRIGARAEGHVGAEQSVTVVSGERGKRVKLSLAPERPAAPPDTEPFTPPPPPPAPRPVPLSLAPQGYYVIGAASLLWPLGHPRAFPEPEANSGGAGSIRVGYRVNTPAAFDLMLQYANINIESDDTAYQNASYTLGSTRLGLNVRLMTPGQTWRFVGSIGGGLTYDEVRFHNVGTTDGDICGGRCRPASGVNAFVFSEVGVELDLDGVLLGFSLDSYFQSSRGIDYEQGEDGPPLYSSVLLHLGGSLHAGYAFW